MPLPGSEHPPVPGAVPPPPGPPCPCPCPPPGAPASAVREEAARSGGGARAGMAAPGALEAAAGGVPGTKVELTVSCR